MSLTYENVEYDLNALFSFDLLKTLLMSLSQTQKDNSDWIKIFDSQLKDRDNLFKEINKAIIKISTKLDNKLERIEANFESIKEQGNFDLVDLKDEDEESSEIDLNLDNFIKDEKYYREKIIEKKNESKTTEVQKEKKREKTDTKIEEFDEVSEEVSVIESEYQEVIKSDGEVEMIKVEVKKHKKVKVKKIREIVEDDETPDEEDEQPDGTKIKKDVT
jgi:hypothetical protein